MPCGQAGDDVEPQRPGRGNVDVTGLSKPLVEFGQLLGRDAQAGVGNLNPQAATEQGLTGDHDLGGWRRELGGVVEQLGQEVCDVVYGASRDQVRRHDAELHPWILLDLAYRCSDDIEDRRCRTRAAHLLDAGQNQEALGMPADTGGEVVDAEQGSELVGITFTRLQTLDSAQLTVDERLRTPRQVDDDRVQILPEQRLFTRYPDRCGSRRR